MSRIMTARAACLVLLFAMLVTGLHCQSEKKAGKRDERTKDVSEPRSIEPRLSVLTTWRECPSFLPKGHVVHAARCDSSNTLPRGVSVSIEDCRDMTTNQAEALTVLNAQPDCTDAAVQRLELVDSASAKAATASDLAAAYSVRAQRKDDPADLLRALETADRAAKLAPDSLPARFNQALALEALGLSKEALRAWNDIRRRDRSPWGNEAGWHWKRLSHELSLRAASQWPLNRERLSSAVELGDHAAVAQLIAPFSFAAESYVEFTLLPAWGQDLADGHIEKAEQHLREAEKIAVELARISGDRYLLDGVELLTRSSHRGHTVPAELREGHAFLGKGFVEPNPAKSDALYRKAQALLHRAGSPLYLKAAIARAEAMSQQDGKLSLAIDLLAPIEREARRRGYRGVLARVQAQRAFCLLFKSRYLDALLEYDAALRNFERIRDLESVANTHIRKAGALRVLGHKELAWREAFQARRQEDHVVALRSRHIILGESAAIALELGFAAIALRLQNTAIDMIQEELAGAEAPAAVDALRRHLAIALRGRARILPHLNRLGEARDDLNEAIGLTTGGVDPDDESTRRVLVARLKEVEGQTLLRSNPQRSIEAFTAALEMSIHDEFRTFRANLFVQRAEACKRAGRTADAQRDLEEAVKVLREEEVEILQHRERGSGEALWSLYFGRFRDAYDGLIAQLVGEGRYDTAFAYAEHARAFEPLSLVLRTNVAPKAFRTLSRNGETLSLDRIQAALPEGTFLIDYWVSADRTFVWIISRGQFDFVSEPVRRDEIAEWGAVLRRTAGDHDVEGFAAALGAPYQRLLRAPLEKIEQMPEGKRPDRRLVIVPDGALHGLPFAALRNPATLRHLIEDATVSVAASPTLFVYSKLRDETLPSKGKYPALLIGDPAFDERLEIARGLQRLKHARNEIDGILPLYGARAVDLRDERATVDRFLQAAESSAVVHFAGHAIANPAAPFHSLLLLAPSGSDSGALNAEELMLRFRARDTRLFVLSACSSAGGTDIGPEGLAPLVRPLVTSGVPAVIGSLWSIGDNKDSEDLLVRFHRYFLKGHDAARSLQLAQLDQLNLSRSAHPATQSLLAWAPFQVTGYASSPFPNTTQVRRKLP